MTYDSQSFFWESFPCRELRSISTGQKVSEQLNFNVDVLQPFFNHAVSHRRIFWCGGARSYREHATDFHSVRCSR